MPLDALPVTAPAAIFSTTVFAVVGLDVAAGGGAAAGGGVLPATGKGLPLAEALLDLCGPLLWSGLALASVSAPAKSCDLACGAHEGAAGALSDRLRGGGSLLEGNWETGRAAFIQRKIASHVPIYCLAST